MKTSEIKRSVYPSLPDIMDPMQLAVISTLEPEEKQFVCLADNPRHQYFRALYLKAIAHLGHSRYLPGDLPRLLRLKVLEQLQLPKKFADIFEISSATKSRIVNLVRNFLGIKPYSRKARLQAESFLKKGIAREESDLLILINAAITWFRENAVELPDFSVIAAIAENAAYRADYDLQRLMYKAASKQQRLKLDSLLEIQNNRTMLDCFKEDTGKPSSVVLLEEIQRLQQLESYLFNVSAIQKVSRRKIECFAEITQRYTVSEIRQFHDKRRFTVLYCYLKTRHAQMLDTVADLFIQVWRGVCKESNQHADAYIAAKSYVHERHDIVLQNLLEIICEPRCHQDISARIFKYKTQDEYFRLLQEIKEGISRNECYLRKIEDYYGSLRRFLPDWYNSIPMVSTTTDDSIIKGVAFISKYAKQGVTSFSVKNISNIPDDFLSDDWKRKAFTRHKWDGKIVWVHKAAYELGLAEAIASALNDGRIAISGSFNYAPMTEHLTLKKEFLSNFSQITSDLNLTENASDFYQPLLDTAKEELADYDQRYEELKHIFRVNHDGTLSFLRTSSKETRKQKKLTKILQSYIMKVNILELFLDCHRITGFLDLFQSVSGRQSMKETEWIFKLLGSLYAYGCNCGPTQASQATDIPKQTIAYFRRHYMSTRQLMEASTILVDAYKKTTVSQYLKEPGMFMTDAMHFPTLQDSLTARHYFRDFSKKNILLYQHVTADCVCFFSKALLCGVSEAIHMLDGALNQKSEYKPSVNICDNAGKSKFIWGVAGLLNIEIWARLNSRQNLKLWGMSKDLTYNNIGHAITGIVQPEIIDKGWKDMLWIIASIAEGKTGPSMIAESLRKSHKHPATKGFNELGKIYQTLHMLRYGRIMPFRKTVMKYTARRETWNQFGRNIFHGFGGLLREKDQMSQDEVFWFLTVVQNAIVLWNALALEKAIAEARKDKIIITDEDLKHILPTMIEHINFVGKFLLNFNRQLPFRFAA